MRASKVQFRYTRNEEQIFEIPCGIDDAVIVVGDPDNAAYEWVIHRFGVGVLAHSDDAYGAAEVALRDGLTKYLER